MGTYAVILAGGSGTRFWPLSRRTRPKQFLPITGKKVMISETAERLRGWIPKSKILVVTHENQAAQVRRFLPGLPAAQILGEPQARNTAASIAWAAHHIARKDPKGILIVLPADHAIQPVKVFQKDMKSAVAAARTGGLYTMGIPPTYPATGYGYMQRGRSIRKVAGKTIFEVLRFTEKPSHLKAKRFLASGKYYWNSGMFIWRADAILEAMEQFMPVLHRAIQQIPASTRTAAGRAKLKKAYASVHSISIDYGIMEKADNVRMLEASFSWNDVGSWRALGDLLRKKNIENVSVFPSGGELMEIDSINCLAYSEKNHLIAAIGLEDVVIVRTDDVTLVCQGSRAEEVKAIVERLSSENRRKHL